jgi:DNA mismatch endonuclease (patch repair protein)
MKRVKSKDTTPEIHVRRLLRRLGYRGYRLHRPDLPGKPDIAWLGHKQAIFVHGCFWHGHSCARGARVPKTRVEYWSNKIERNVERDAAAIAKLAEAGWRVLILWECDLRDENELVSKLRAFLERNNV